MSNNILENKAHELQNLEQNIRSIIMQKQTMQIELNEISNALEELSKTKDEVYDVIGQIMIKSDKNTLIKKLEEKKRIAEIKISTIEKQEHLLEKKASSLREELSKEFSKNK